MYIIPYIVFEAIMCSKVLIIYAHYKYMYIHHTLFEAKYKYMYIIPYLKIRSHYVQ